MARQKRKTDALTTTGKHELEPIEQPLTDLEALFIENYFAMNMNGTEAALATFDVTSERNVDVRNTAASIASEYLRKPHVRARVDARFEQFHISANEVLARIAYHATGTLDDFIDENGTIDIRAAKRAKALGLVKHVRQRTTRISDENNREVETTETDVELYDAQKSLQDLAKIQGLFIERSVNANVDFTALSDEELEGYIKTGKLPDGVKIVRRT